MFNLEMFTMAHNCQNIHVLEKLCWCWKYSYYVCVCLFVVFKVSII